MNNKLPLVSIFLEALSFPARYRRLLLKVGAPVVIVGGLYTIFDYYSADVEESLFLYVLDFILALAAIFTMVIGIVGCHRILLLGKGSVEGSSPFS
ncbi:MAG: hypothetical protein VXZ35_00665, partial [Pseudomonadota bacterium]|nr:hypothetical protein [Pseudomonadota bacterium]